MYFIPELPMPDPGHSPVGLIEPVKKSELTEEQKDLFIQQIEGYSNKLIFDRNISILYASTLRRKL